MFRSQMVTLAGDAGRIGEFSEWTFTEIVLFINYFYENKSMSIHIFDYGTQNAVIPTVELTDEESTAEVLNQIFKDFPGVLDEQKLLETVSVYFAGVKNSLVYKGELALDPTICDRCGVQEFDLYEIRYFPAVPGTKLNEDSLEIYWEYACNHISILDGTIDDSACMALMMFARMSEIAFDGPKKEIAHIVDIIKSKTA